MGGYQTAKYAVEGFSEVLSNEVRPLGIKVTIVEPGAFRTDWGGSSMRMLPVSKAYEPTVGEMNRYRRAVDGQQAGDPARAARIITEIAALDQPPLRLLLGSDAVRIAGESAQARAAEAAEWAAVSRSADFGAGSQRARPGGPA
jgi:NAD(P)-dependent dehydrogenase (short-subunit alcohol dehydrogenase family)